MFLSFPAFSAGELSPLLEGRSDLSALRMGCRLARNVIPARLGALLQRPGLMYRGRASYQGDEKVNQIAFVASADVAYKIEAGPFYFRFWRNGALLLTTAENATRPGVTSALGAPLVITTPYPAGVLFELQTCHANDVMWITHPDYPVQKLIRYAVDEFEMAPMAYLFPPLRDGNVAEITLAASGTLTVGGTVSLLAAGGDVFEAGDVGGYYGIDHRRSTPFAEISLSEGSGTATALLIFSGQPVAGETFNVGTGPNLRTYTWAVVASAPYAVTIGGTVPLSAAAAVGAITAVGATPGTIAHPSVIAADLGTFAGGVKAAGVLFFTDNNLTAGSFPDEFIIGAQAYPYSDEADFSGATPAFTVRRGATLADSILNGIMALNASGIAYPTAGYNYSTGTTANPDVAADPAAIGSSLRVQADTAGAAGNAITTTVDHTSRMAWSNGTLTGGADAATNQIQVTARIEGESGNLIAVSETMTNAVWQPTTALTGGADNTSFDPSNLSAVIPTVRVNGSWEVYTLGRWYGLLTLQQQRTTGEWEVVRTWDSKNDRNVQATGIVDGEKLMRLIFVGAGIADDDAPARAVLTATDAVVHGLVLITAVTDAQNATGTVVRAIWSTEATYLWSEGSWSERRGYPSAVVLHQQRLTFGQGARLTGSQTGGFDNFERTELADSSYQYELAATVAQNIVSMQSQEGLTILAEDSEWIADGGTDGGVITPGGIRVQKLTEYGAARAPSLIVGSNIIFIQAGGLVANEYLFQFNNQDFEAVDLSELADHLTGEGLVQLAFAPVPHSLIFFVTQAGSLLSLSYRRKQGAAGDGGMLAWSKHTTPDASTAGIGVIESVCVTPATNEVSDVSCFIRRRLPNGSFVRTFESFDPGYWENLKINTSLGSNVGVGIGSLVVPDGSVRVGFLTDPATVTGLDHLEGMAVQILLNGTRHPDQQVSGGQVTLDMTDVLEPATAVVGLAPLAQIQPWFASLQLRDGSTDGRSFKVAKLNARWYLAGAAQYADDNEGATFYDVNFRLGTDAVGQPVPLATRLIKSDLAGGHKMQTEFIFRNQGPLPLNLLGVTAEIAING